MKKLLFFFVLSFSVLSCSSDSSDKSTEFLLPIESVSAPSTAYHGQTMTFQVSYRRPTDCHLFNGFYTDSDGNAQILAVRALKFDQNNCMDDTDNLYDVPYEFTPDLPGTYVFKFWKGDTPNATPEYLEYEIIVE